MNPQKAPATATAVIVFAKAPIPGQAKTRLAPVLGEDGAAELATRMLEQAVETACAAALGPVEICATPDIADPAFAALAGRYEVSLVAQGGGDLGSRMDRALSRLLRMHARVLLMGTDAPGIDTTRLRQAAAALTHHDAVFIPAFDGGYALIGLRRPAPELFAGIAWSTPKVMAATRERASRFDLRIAELAPVFDIDEPADLVHVPQQLLQGLRIAPRAIPSHLQRTDDPRCACGTC